ncbi:transposase InsO family protein [Mycobacteroides chelonae]|nr:transposase InsO family protein [Mycobacteroides chelonae]
MGDRSSRPHRIAAHLRLPRFAVEAVLRRYRMPLLRHLDQASRLAVRRPTPVRYEHPAPGDLVHVDIKKLGRIPDGGGHRKLGRTVGNRNNKKKSRGYAYVHHAVDDHGIIVKRVLTDNGSYYRSKDFAAALTADITHKRTRPYRPLTNGKVERFNRTLNQEWAYAHNYLTDEDRAATYPDWLHHYSHHKTPHRHQWQDTDRTRTRSQPPRERTTSPPPADVVPPLADQTRWPVITMPTDSAGSG